MAPELVLELQVKAAFPVLPCPFRRPPPEKRFCCNSVPDTQNSLCYKGYHKICIIKA